MKIFLLFACCLHPSKQSSLVFNKCWVVNVLQHVHCIHRYSDLRQGLLLKHWIVGMHSFNYKLRGSYRALLNQGVQLFLHSRHLNALRINVVEG